MSKQAYAVKLSALLLKDLRIFCHDKGYNQSSFVEKALREQMLREEMKEDIFDLVTLRAQESLACPLSEYRYSRR